MHVYTCVSMCALVSAYVHVCQHMCTCVSICACVSAYVHLCQHMCMCVSIRAVVSANVHVCQHTADVQQSKPPLGCADISPITDTVCTPSSCLWDASEQSRAKLTWSLWRFSLSLCLCCINLRYSACALCGALAGGGSGAAAACVALPKLDPQFVGKLGQQL